MIQTAAAAAPSIDNVPTWAIGCIARYGVCPLLPVTFRFPVTSLAAWSNHLAVQQPGGQVSYCCACCLEKANSPHLLRIPALFVTYYVTKLTRGFNLFAQNSNLSQLRVLCSKCSGCVALHADMIQSLHVFNGCYHNATRRDRRYHQF